MGQKDEDGMANNVDPDQTAPLIWVYTICLDLFVRKLRIITVFFITNLSDQDHISILLNMEQFFHLADANIMYMYVLFRRF